MLSIEYWTLNNFLIINFFMQNNGLGRGLSSLIPQKAKKMAETSKGEVAVNIVGEDEKGKILNIAPNKMKTNPLQPRSNFSGQAMDELMESIKQHGIIQPLIASKNNGDYELIAGERRLRAARALGLKTVPVIIREIKEQEKLEVALIENIQRQDLNAVEQALAFRKLINEFNLSQEDMSNRVGKSRSSVSNSLRILNLPEEIQQALIEGRISEGHSKVIVGLDSPEKQMALFKKIIRGDLSVDNCVKEARVMGGTKAARIKINYGDKDKEFAFREFFGAKVEVKRKGNGGQIIIDFYSDDELREIVDKVKG